MDKLSNFFKNNEKQPPEYIWHNIEKRINSSSYRESEKGSNKKSKLIFSLSFAVVFLIIGFSIYYLINKPSTSVNTVPHRAIVTFVMGNAEMETADGNIKPLKVGVEVTKARVIRTRENSRVDIKMTSGSLFTVSAGSEMKLASVLMPKKKIERTNIDLYRGRLVIEPTRIQDSGNFEVNTPTAVAGVRGTRFSVSYNQDAESTRVAVQRGKVVVKRKLSIDVNKKVKAKIYKTINAQTRVNRGESVVISRNENERISEVINRDIDQIQSRIAGNSNIENLNSINAARRIAGINNSRISNTDRRIFENISTHRETVKTVKVLIPDKGGVLYVNGVESIENTYVGYFKPGTKIRVRIQKQGFLDFNKVITVPDNTSIFRPGIVLKKPQPVRVEPQYREVEREITVERVAFQYNSQIEPSTIPIEKDGKIYFVSTDGHLYCINTSNQGSIEWKLSINSTVDTIPVIKDKVLYLGAKNKVIYAVSIDNGSVLWKKKFGTMLFKSKITARSTRIYFGTIEGYVYSVSKTTGDIIWRKKLEGGIWGSVYVSNNKVYVGCEDENIYALNRNNGDVIWKRNVNRRVIAPVFFVDNKVIAINYDGVMFGINSNTGEIKWNKEIGNISGNPVISGDKVFIASNKRILSINPSTGNVVINKNINNGNISLNSYNNRVFAAVGHNTVISISAAGQIIWQHKQRNKIFGLPLGNEHSVFTVSAKGNIIKLRRKISKIIKVRQRIE